MTRGAGRRSLAAAARAAAAAWTLLTMVGSGCGRSPDPERTGNPASATPPSATERSFTVRGVVRDVPADHRALLIRHDEIPGYMPKMTMELTLLDTNEATRVQVGDTIEFRLVARAEDHFIDRIRVVDHAPPATPPSIATPALPDAAPAQGAELRTGDPVPDVAFLSETGRVLRFSNFQGRAVAFTFFFTRCPLPDFCPLMNRNLLETRRRLQAAAAAAAAGPTNWTLLSVSFDAGFDQPAVLASHARTYRGTNTAGWEFVSADTRALALLRPAFDLKIAREDGSFSHNLRTVVLDTQGRVYRQFDGNRWTAEELAEAVTGACRLPSTTTTTTPPADAR